MMMSLLNRVAIAVGVASVGVLTFWCGIFGRIGIAPMPISIETLQHLDHKKKYQAEYQTRLPVKKRQYKITSEKIPLMVKEEEKAKPQRLTYKSGMMLNVVVEELEKGSNEKENETEKKKKSVAQSCQ